MLRWDASGSTWTPSYGVVGSSNHLVNLLDVAIWAKPMVGVRGLRPLPPPGSSFAKFFAVAGTKGSVTLLHRTVDAQSVRSFNYLVTILHRVISQCKSVTRLLYVKA